MYKSFILILIIVCMYTHANENTYNQKIDEYIKLTLYKELFEVDFYKRVGGNTKENRKKYELVERVVLFDLTNEFMKVWSDKEITKILIFMKSEPGKIILKQVKSKLDGGEYKIPDDEQLKLTQFANTKFGKIWASGLNKVRVFHQSLLTKFLNSGVFD